MGRKKGFTGRTRIEHDSTGEKSLECKEKAPQPGDQRASLEGVTGTTGRLLNFFSRDWTAGILPLSSPGELVTDWLSGNALVPR